MDSIDLKILSLLQSDATISIATIGERVGLSQTPCWKRIQRLEADGVIDRRVAVLDPVKLGLGLTVFVSFETAHHARDWLDRFADEIAPVTIHGRKAETTVDRDEHPRETSLDVLAKLKAPFRREGGTVTAGPQSKRC